MQMNASADQIRKDFDDPEDVLLRMAITCAVVAERERCAMAILALVGTVTQDRDAYNEALEDAIEAIRKDLGSDPPQVKA